MLQFTIKEGECVHVWNGWEETSEWTKQSVNKLYIQLQWRQQKTENMETGKNDRL